MNGVALRSGNGLRLLDRLFTHPLVSVKLVEKMLDLSQPAALALVDAFQAASILREVTGLRRNRIFEFRDYLRLFEERDQRI
jgi:hypothetical protein